MFIAFVLTAFVAGGIAMVVHALWNARQSLAAAGWPTAPGRLLACSLEEHPDSEGQTTYAVTVAYTYTVNDVRYSGSRLAFGYTGTSNRAAQQQIFDRLQSARSIEVRYDPANPARSTLSHGLHRSLRYHLLAALFLVAFTIMMLLLWLGDHRLDETLLQNLILH
jgi:hypothetical protein